MSLKRYNVLVNGYETTLQLSDEDAEAAGLTPSDAIKPAKSKTAANKARPAVQNKAGDADADKAGDDKGGDAADDSAGDDKADGGAADQG